MNPPTNHCISLGLMLLMFSCRPADKGSLSYIHDVTSQVDDSRLVNADKTPGDWLSYGRNYAEDRFSSLDQVTKQNVNKLGLAWSVDLGSKRGIEATPIVVDGIMYLSGVWSKVYAINVRSGKIIWTFDPKVPPTYGEKACCDVVNRGVALYKGMVYIGTLDGRLISIDASTGKSMWEVNTIDTTKPYTITGAPRVVEGKVIIGNGGAEYGVRGYITAYDAISGKQAWRFYTVPGDPSKPFESEAMKMAAKTWSGNWWEYGGGGTAWDAMAYDPELKLLYVGTGNGSPWNRKYRSPDGGDNLFLSSIVALNPDDGKLVWYYQTTPGEGWDYTATQPLVLADIDINSEKRKVIMQAPKNGFFYVVDRTNGKLISAKPYVYVNWAKEVDLKTGKPVESDFARYTKENAELFPGPIGGHNWQPMAYSPKTKLMYLPVRDNSQIYGDNPDWKFNKVSGFASGTGWNLAVGYDASKPLRQDSLAPKKIPQERLIAWDPVQQRQVWALPLTGVWNSGVVATASGLVFEGTADGKLIAVDADNGKILWQANIGSGIIAPPISYAVDGKQYISIAAGWGGVAGLGSKFTEQINPGTIYTFALDSTHAMPVFPKAEAKKLIDIPFTATAKQVEHGKLLFSQYCGACHNLGTGGGVIPDLTYSSEGVHEIFNNIVLGGALLQNGMPKFKGRLTEQEVQEVHDYILSTAKEQIVKQQK